MDYISIALFSFVVGVFAKSIYAYSTKKSENLATKEDIAEITKNQKEVENIINQKFNNNQSILEQQRKVVIDFYNQFLIINCLLSDINLYDNILLSKNKKDNYNKLNKEFNQLLIYSSNIDLLLKDNDVIKLKQNITKELKIIILHLYSYSSKPSNDLHQAMHFIIFNNLSKLNKISLEFNYSIQNIIHYK